MVSLRIFEKHGNKVRKIRFGEPIYDVAAVTERIRRAQRALLNLSTNADMFLNGPDEDLALSEKTFSEDCIHLEIKGKDVPDLSFIDLPGLSSHITPQYTFNRSLSNLQVSFKTRTETKTKRT